MKPGEAWNGAVAALKEIPPNIDKATSLLTDMESSDALIMYQRILAASANGAIH